MHAHAQPILDATVHLPAGRVRLTNGDRCTIALEQGGDVIARQAASCLLQPRAGDRVLLTLSPEPFILAVLERDEKQEAVLRVAGDARLHADGQLSLEGRHSVAIRSGGLLAMVAKTVKVHSTTTEIASRMLTAVAKAARAKFETAGVVGEQLDVVAERISERAARVYRTVTELDQLRAKHFDHRADGHARISADSTVITARQVVKMDGEQVHIG